ncbi:MAG: hypothetical protein LBM87_05120 [Ruminococcus sp.]|jgi:hypothetical protein|nr:hypothetical protein [Ruminococcus sp.]
MAKKSKNPGAMFMKAPDRKYTFIIFIIYIIGAVALRVHQLITATDLNTGIYLKRSFFNDYPILWLLGGAVILAVTLFMFSSNDKKTESVIMINPMHQNVADLSHNYGGAAGAITLICAGTIVGDIVMGISGTVAAYNLAPQYNEDGELISGLTAVSGGNWVVYVIMGIAALTLVLTGVSILRGMGITPGNCFFLITVAVWKMAEIFSIFFQMQQQSRIIQLYSEKIYIIFGDMCLIMFFFQLIRLFSNMSEKHTRIKLMFWGYVSAAVLAVSAIPRFVVLFTEAYTERASVAIPSFSDVGFILFTVAVILPLFGHYKYRDMEKLSYRDGHSTRWTEVIPEEEQVMNEIEISTDAVEYLNSQKED